LADLQSELFLFDAAGAEMSGIQTINVSNSEANKLLAIEEGHFVDLKAIDTSPAGLTRAIAALANAEGGELFIGVDEDTATKKRSWRGFANPEAANAHLKSSSNCFR
jgi:ATP-dependent DNA helicase RecG